MSEGQMSATDPHARIAAAVTELYPRLLVLASHLQRRFRVQACDIDDLSQEGVLSALRFGEHLPAERLASLCAPELRAILISVATRSMQGRLVDRMRRADYERGRRRLFSAEISGETSALTPQEVVVRLEHMLRKQSGAARKVLECVLKLGELDIPEICAQSGLSRGYVYRILERLSAEERASPR